ncbi:formylglycine-generating enzyme family protein [Pyxidicoccus xibeiensis]|uniref:formylglycine-generating enzyme family protein n=1 Tax=Pyxidicoccus xibeiensis TaxID=2906759 RepID=UPI0020A7A81C|nr:SUMF1/EgtB/PvdO family nonheme iron enzyme [Pyxidicoccus xibeiensis]MCP3138154.1 formylglycine-generating enzyme family protein [Pyxidicoccus xibeiensis]
MRGSARVALAFLLGAAAPLPAAHAEEACPSDFARPAPEARPPEGMRVVPAGRFWMGRKRSPRADETPRHAVCVDAFFLDETLVTVEAFARFTERTGYKTTAEQLGYGMVAEAGLAEWEWRRTPGATWRAPFGASPPKDYAPRPDHPVTMVSHVDALAYCRAHGLRLPTEAEWEYAMRAGTTDTRFPWGDSPKRPDASYGLNFWQGADHRQPSGEDGHVYLSPVRAFPANAWGFFDPVGNVWQLVADVYDSGAYARRAAGVRNPVTTGAGEERVTRGGSWWCSAKSCHGYGLFYRGKARPEAPFNNVGFRCAKDVEGTRPRGGP